MGASKLNKPVCERIDLMTEIRQNGKMDNCPKILRRPCEERLEADNWGFYSKGLISS